MAEDLILLALAWSLRSRSLAGSAPAPQAHRVPAIPTHTISLFLPPYLTSSGIRLPGARVRVRRADEKKFRWEALSDHQGEVGIRVPQDAEYEMTWKRAASTADAQEWTPGKAIARI